MESYIEPEKIEGGLRRLLLQMKEEKWKKEIIEKTIKEHKETIKILSNLSNKLNHKIIVPFSRIAFFEGEIKYTNNIFQNLGGNAFCERTSKNAEKHLQRKLSLYEEKHKIIKESINKLTKEAELALEIKEGAKWENNEGAAEGVFLRPDGFLEIREKYDSDEEKCDKQKMKEKMKQKKEEKEEKEEIEVEAEKGEKLDVEGEVEKREHTASDECISQKESIKKEEHEKRGVVNYNKEWGRRRNILNTQNTAFHNKAINKDEDGLISIKENYSSSSSSSNYSDCDEQK